MGSGEICGGSGGGKPRRWHLSGGQHTQQTCRSIGREERSELDGVAPLPQKHRVKDDPLNRPYCGYDGQPIQWAVPGVVKLADLCRIREYMLLLFETPSGFAVFLFCGSLINPPRSLEDIWLNFADSNTAKGVVLLMEFQTFEDKSSAINQNTGVSERLADMIRAWLPGKKMAVGKPEYKEIIEERLEIECLYNKRVMEVMWGIQNCMPGLIPIEKSQLAKEDRLPIMREAGAVIKDVSGISCEGWSLLDIATALKMIWKPKKVGNSSLKTQKTFAFHFIDKEMLKAHDYRISKEDLLKSLVEGLKKP
ncbi:hypothetical protein TRIUR3_32467 [Triticum urartu]|uniref:Uncharacterized protein n=1 Tax=Triticum urartu TaxID=4572 RepID=M7Z3V7_TRIUA|nr:hypothetical protein TRIUR3_32467 [Triticum urartu]